MTNKKPININGHVLPADTMPYLVALCRKFKPGAKIKWVAWNGNFHGIFKTVKNPDEVWLIFYYYDYEDRGYSDIWRCSNMEDVDLWQPYNGKN
jgi:hypothetical protein